METSLELNEDLKALGMRSMFEKDLADFSAMTSFQGMFVAKVFQKTVIEVNEYGTEAASASGMTTVSKSLPRRFR
jgi:serine protease inhibitor